MLKFNFRVYCVPSIKPRWGLIYFKQGGGRGFNKGGGRGTSLRRDNLVKMTVLILHKN